MPRPRRHHFLPVFLLERFAFEGQGRRARVRALRRDRGCIETSVSNIGIEKDFHSDRSMFRDPEHLLSTREQVFDSELHRWRVGLLDDRGAAIADEFVAHLRVRSRVIRELGRQLMQAVRHRHELAILRAVGDAASPISLSAELAQAIESALSREPMVESPRLLVEDRLRPILRSHLTRWMREEVASAALGVLGSKLPAEWLDAVHTQVILLQSINRRRREFFGNCRWSVAEVADDSLLLGDVGPLAVLASDAPLSCLWASSQAIAAILLPIAPDRLLVGSVLGSAPPPDAATINEATLALSHEFVVGIHPRDWLESRWVSLGARAAEDSPETVLGIGATDGRDVIERIAESLDDWCRCRFDAHWDSHSPLAGPVQPHEPTR